MYDNNFIATNHVYNQLLLNSWRYYLRVEMLRSTISNKYLFKCFLKNETWYYVLIKVIVSKYLKKKCRVFQKDWPPKNYLKISLGALFFVTPCMQNKSTGYPKRLTPKETLKHFFGPTFFGTPCIWNIEMCRVGIRYR